MRPALTLDELNRAAREDFTRLLDGTYEHSPWIADRACDTRPFATLAALKHALVRAVRDSGREAQLGLIRSHPELAGKAMVARTLTAESTHEQDQAGLTHCTSEEFERIQDLNARYNEKFGFPFILAVRGPRGTGLDKAQIIATFARRLEHHPDFEFAEALRNIHRIAEIRLDDRFGTEPVLGNQVWDWAERLATHSEPGYAERGELTVTYLSDAHRAVAQRLAHWMKADCGFDEVAIDAVGNVVGLYHGDDRRAPRLLTGSHYDTVRNGGRYDGRLGILVPMACVQALSRAGRRLPFGLEVVGFSEEEGQRYRAVFLGSGALTGSFDPAWLEQTDADGVTLRQAMERAGLCVADIPKLRRDASRYRAFVEVHIEQGPVLSELDLPGGSGQVVVNDEAAFPRAGRSALALRPRAGENRLEATLVEGRGPGTWRFDLQPVRGLRPESLRVIAGEAAQVGGGAVTFRLRGRAGERIVLSFRVDP